MSTGSLAGENVACAHCGADQSPLWRRGVMGEILCNACGLYWRHHGTYRPLSLKLMADKRAAEAADVADMAEPVSTLVVGEPSPGNLPTPSPPPSSTKVQMVQPEKARSLLTALQEHRKAVAVAAAVRGLPQPSIRPRRHLASHNHQQQQQPQRAKQETPRAEVESTAMGTTSKVTLSPEIAAALRASLQLPAPAASITPPPAAMAASAGFPMKSHLSSMAPVSGTMPGHVFPHPGQSLPSSKPEVAGEDKENEMEAGEGKENQAKKRSMTIDLLLNPMAARGPPAVRAQTPVPLPPRLPPLASQLPVLLRKPPPVSPTTTPSPSPMPAAAAIAASQPDRWGNHGPRYLLHRGRLLFQGDQVAIRGDDGHVYFALIRDFLPDRRFTLRWLLPRTASTVAQALQLLVSDNPSAPLHLSPGLFTAGPDHGKPETLDAIIDVFYSPQRSSPPSLHHHLHLLPQQQPNAQGASGGVKAPSSSPLPALNNPPLHDNPPRRLSILSTRDDAEIADLLVRMA